MKILLHFQKCSAMRPDILRLHIENIKPVFLKQIVLLFFVCNYTVWKRKLEWQNDQIICHNVKYLGSSP